jgi:hypothetical protein
MKRFTIDSFADGHVAVTTLTSIEGGGSAHDRKVRLRQEQNGTAPERKWSREDRKIFRQGVKESFQVGSRGDITLLPFGSEEISQCAKENEEWARIHARYAAATVKVIENLADAFDHDATRSNMPKVKKVVIVYENGTVEDLC